jgi:hypothetical protein
MTRLRRTAGLSLLALLGLGYAGPAAAISGEEFYLRSGADVVALCATPVTDPLYTAAIHMCHGFGAGTFQTIMALTRHDKLQPLICPPAPLPSRNETVGRFLEWAKRNPEHLRDAAVETVGRFFITEFPCRSR